MEEAEGEVQTAVCRRLPRAAQRRGLLSAHDTQVMAEWEHGGGFSVDAQMRIEAHEREGRERLMRYCARPAFALEQLREIDPEHLHAVGHRRPDRVAEADDAVRHRVFEVQAQMDEARGGHGRHSSASLTAAADSGAVARSTPGNGRILPVDRSGPRRSLPRIGFALAPG